ncbi:hypothetical protein ES705_35368 [subsurface metagenome]
MKKFLIVLTVIAMASLLMGAGCFVSNLPPVITSDPVKTATVGVAYTYNVDATDPDIEDVLTYYLTAYPNGMTIDSATGLIKWKPAIEGDYKVTVKVSDGDLDIYQGFTIVVKEPSPVNQAPVIDSIPITTATVGVKYTYTIKATDPEGDKITYSLVSWPVGMGFNGISTISWTPTKGQVGLHDVTVEASDGELSTPQCFTILVSADEPVITNNPPEITSSAITSGKVGVEYIYGVEADDPDVGDVLTFSLTEKPLGMSIVPTTGIISWIPTDAGLFAVNVKVSDGDLTDTQSFSITVAAADGEEPPVEETDPPVITSVPLADDGYINKEDEAGEITVTGFSIDGYLVKLYLDDKLIGTTIASKTKSGYGVFGFTLKDIDWGEEGEKNLYATAQKPGCIVSDPSDPYTFILDTTAPKILGVAIKAEGLLEGDEVTTTVTCSEAIDEDSLVVDLVVNGEVIPAGNAGNIWEISSGPYFNNSGDLNIVADSIEYDLVAPEVFELIGEFGENISGSVCEEEGTIIRVEYRPGEASGSDVGVIYVPITDLAGNGLVDSVHVCLLEVAE